MHNPRTLKLRFTRASGEIVTIGVIFSSYLTPTLPPVYYKQAGYCKQPCSSKKRLSFHVLDRGDEEYLYVDGIGIKTGDIFQFYYSDPNTALASLTKVHDALKSIHLEKNSKSSKGDGDNATNVFGGIIFACYSRGESFFGRQNVDSSPFLENFPGVPVSGIFCGGEMVRPCTTVIGQCEGASPISCCLHVYSTVYLAMSYTPPSVED